MNRRMTVDNANFVFAAYLITLVAVAVYTWTLTRRLRRAKRESRARTSDATERR